MAHCKPDDLKDLHHLLESIRKISVLNEKSFGCFYIKSKSMLHFHLKKERRFIHLWNGNSWEEIDLVAMPTNKKQVEYFKMVQSKLLLK